MQANLRSVLAQVTRGGRYVGSRRNFGSYLENSGKYVLFPSVYPREGGRIRRVTRQITEKACLFGGCMVYGYCAVMGWATIQMFEHRRRTEIDLAERLGSKPKTGFRDVLRWFGGGN